MSYKESELKDLQYIIDKGVALLVTATDLETIETHNYLKPLQGQAEIIQVYEGAATYYFGVFGKYNIVHVQSSMGSIGRDSAILTVSNSIKLLKPKFVLMIGIAFGIDSTKQNIGDVLIAEGIIPYNVKRIGENIVHRGQNAPSSKILLNRFKSIKTWQYILPNETTAKKVLTQVLSGEELIDNVDRRDELFEAFPHAKGGEMEGAGLYSACDNEADWILIKGICDFADGKKSVNKRSNQLIAVNSALSLCSELFHSDHAFKSLELEPTNMVAGKVLNSSEARHVLFEVYNEKLEPYYITREEDIALEKVLEHYCIWTYGISGCGKTNLILRNLLHKQSPHITISLAACIDFNVLEVFKEIFFDLQNYFDFFENKLENSSFSNISRNIIALLKQYCSNKDYVIFIEEIPVSNDHELQTFISHFFSLLISKKLVHELDGVKFVLSSIGNPSVLIRPNQIKIHQQLKFIELQNWDKKETFKLIDLICDKLGLNLNYEKKNKILITSKGSPRFVKKFFLNILTSGKSEYNFDHILNVTEGELKSLYNG